MGRVTQGRGKVMTTWLERGGEWGGVDGEELRPPWPNLEYLTLPSLSALPYTAILRSAMAGP